MAIPEKTITDAGGATGKPPAPPVSTTPAAGPPDGSAPKGPASASPSAFGGNPTGRTSQIFKFAANTPEGQAERKQRDADRKAAARAVAATIVNPLPSAPVGDPQAIAGPGGTVAPGEVAAPFVPWEAAKLKPLVDQLMEAIDNKRADKFLKRCDELGDMPKLIDAIKKDAHISKEAKEFIIGPLTRMMAKGLNATGISSEWQDPLTLLSGLLLIFKQGYDTNKRIDAALAGKEKTTTPATTEPIKAK